MYIIPGNRDLQQNEFKNVKKWQIWVPCYPTHFSDTIATRQKYQI